MTLYNEMEQAIRAHQEKLSVSDDTEESDVRHAVRWVMRDTPDIFWFVHQYRFDPEGKTVSLRYQFSKERSECLRRSIDDVVNNDFQIGYKAVVATSQLAFFLTFVINL